MGLSEIIENVAKAVEVLGAVVILIGVGWSLVQYIRGFRSRTTPPPYTSLRRSLGRAILVGLEFLVAADIIHTIATPPTFQTLGVLGLLILIRTFLSVEIEMEIEGRWPWQEQEFAQKEAAGTESG